MYIGKCPDLIADIHGDERVKLYGELCEVIDDVVSHFKEQDRQLPIPCFNDNTGSDRTIKNTY